MFRWLTAIRCVLALTGVACAEQPDDQPVLFNSSLHLKVYERGTDGARDRIIGTTPAKRPLSIPRNAFWYVRPLDSLTPTNLTELASNVRTFKMSGLDLSGHSELSDENLQSLQSLVTLQMLDLSETSITDRGVEMLRPLKELKTLIAPESITDQGLIPLSTLPHLRELTLDQTHVTNTGIQRLSKGSALERLDISATAITDRALQDLAKLPHLHQLILNSAITDAGAAYLKASKSLEELDCSQTQIGDSGMKDIAALPHLLTLYVGKGFGDLGAEHLAFSPSLKSLDLTHSAITDEGVKALQPLKTLQELALSQTAVGNISVAYLAQLPELRMLELSDTGITSAGLAPLASSPHLEIISLSWTHLNRQDLKGLAQLAHLQTIVLNGVPLPPATMAQLRRLAYKPPVKTLATKTPMALAPVPDVAPAALNRESIELKPLEKPKLTATNSKPFKNKPGQLATPLPPTTPAFSDLAESQPQNPEQAAREKAADHLLKTIVFQSNPARGGGFSSLTDLKQVRIAGTQGRLSDIIDDPKQETIADEENRPEDSVGEISVGVKRKR